MSPHLRPHSPPAQANGIWRATSPTRRSRGGASAAPDPDPFEIDFETLIRSPDNAITDQVSLTQPHPSIHAVLQPAQPNVVAPVPASTTSHSTHGPSPAATSQDQRLLRKNAQSAASVPHNFTAPPFSGAGIFGKTIDVWRVPLPDEEAANEPPPDVETTTTLELRYDWARAITDEDMTCELHRVRKYHDPVTTGSENHVLWM
jgi:hypothetical protein